MVSISLCMIVKNEETVLARCLDSIVDLMDEVIIVDTGSTDHTVEIAKRYTNQIYTFEWIQDFAAARNYSFGLATKEYIYVADADEVLDAENHKRFAYLKEALLPEIEIVQMYYRNQLQNGTTYNFDKEYRPKLFRRQRSFVWEEPIHEMVRLQPVIFDSEIEIDHCPLTQHNGRDFKIFQRQWEKGNHLSKRLHHMYAMELMISGEDSDAIEAEAFFQQSSEEEGRSVEECKEAFCVLARCARIRKDVNAMLRIATKDIATQPSAEVCCELARYYREQGYAEEAIVWYYNAWTESKAALCLAYQQLIPLKGLAEVYGELGNQEQADYYEKQLINPDNKDERI